MSRRLLAWLAAALLATLWVASQDQDQDLAAAPRDRKADRPAASPAMPPARTDDAWAARSIGLGVLGWQERASAPVMPAVAGQAGWQSQQAPAPPPVEVAPPPPPAAPPFQHAWVGRLIDDSGVRAVVAGPRTTWVLSPGDVIEGQWRVDQIKDKQMHLTYLPLQLGQVVSLKSP